MDGRPCRMPSLGASYRLHNAARLRLVTRFLPVTHHQRGAIVWAAEGRNAASLQAFFDQLTDEQKASIKAVSIDMSAGYQNAIRSEQGLPHAAVCFDPFHVVKVRHEALPVRAGCKTLPPGCRGSPVKLRTV